MSVTKILRINKYVLQEYVDKATANSMMTSFSRANLTNVQHTVVKGNSRYQNNIDIISNVAYFNPSEVITYYENKLANPPTQNPMHLRGFKRNIKIMKRILDDGVSRYQRTHNSE